MRKVERISDKTIKQKIIYTIKKLTTSMSSLVFGVMFLGMIKSSSLIPSLFNLTDNQEEDGVKNKIEELSLISNTLQNLDTYINEQKTIIIEQQKTIEDLLLKNKELSPIVSSNQATVDAIMHQAKHQNSQDQWIDRLLGQVIGIVTTIISPIIVSKSKLILKKLKGTR